MAEETKRKVAADLCSYISNDDKKLHLDVEIPGADKNDIDLRIKEDSFYLSAPRGDIEYVATGSFCCPVKIDDVDAKYENGLLEIVVPFKDPMEEAVTVSIH